MIGVPPFVSVSSVLEHLPRSGFWLEQRCDCKLRDRAWGQAWRPALLHV